MRGVASSTAAPRSSRVRWHRNSKGSLGLAWARRTSNQRTWNSKRPVIQPQVTNNSHLHTSLILYILFSGFFFLYSSLFFLASYGSYVAHVAMLHGEIPCVSIVSICVRLLRFVRVYYCSILFSSVTLLSLPRVCVCRSGSRFCVSCDTQSAGHMVRISLDVLPYTEVETIIGHTELDNMAGNEPDCVVPTTGESSKKAKIRYREPNR